MAMWNQKRCIIAAWSEEDMKLEPRWEKRKTTLNTKSESLLISALMETDNQMLKNGKSAKYKEHKKQKTEVFFWHKRHKFNLKIPKTLNRKSQCPLSLCTDSTVYLYCFHWDSSRKKTKAPKKSFILIMIVRTVLHYIRWSKD